MRYLGIRLPEPRKDSILALGPDLRWRTFALRARAPVRSACPAWNGAPAERWTFERAPGPLVLARVFETGVYLLQDGALRYRRGLGGRQPLTPELLDDDASVLAGSPGGLVRLRLRVRGAGLQGPELERETGFWPLERAP